MAPSTKTWMLAFWMTWILVLKTSSVGAQTTAATQGYDTELLEQYAWLSQQLRYEIYIASTALMTRIINLQSDVSDMDDYIAAQLSDAINTDIYAKAINMTAYIKMNPGVLVSARSPDQYTSTSHSVISVPLSQNGMAFLGDEVHIPMRGVYQVDLRMQMAQYYTSTYLEVYGPDGTELFEIRHVWIYGCNGAVEMFELEAGSIVKMSGLKSFYTWSSWVYADFLMPDYPSQFIVRYMGPIE